MDIKERRSLQYLLNKLVAENRQWNIRDVLIGDEMCIRYYCGSTDAVRIDITEKSTEEALLAFARILCGEKPEEKTVKEVTTDELREMIASLDDRTILSIDFRGDDYVPPDDSEGFIYHVDEPHEPEGDKEL